MKIATVSLNPFWNDKKANQEKCLDYIEFASKNNVNLIIFPEMTLTGFSMNTSLIAEESDQSPTINFFSEQASKYSIFIIAGVVLKKFNRATNNLIFIDNKGTVQSIYSKIHPFSFAEEHNYYIGGEEIIISKLDNSKIGFAICYDLRFPEIFIAMSYVCDVIVIIANWPEKRANHWKILLQARAVENQCFIIGVNRTGIDGNNLNYIKSSLIVDPNGEFVCTNASYNDMDIYVIKLEEVQIVRSSFSIQQDRKKQLYRTLL